jgi:hypothetical protein
MKRGSLDYTYIDYDHQSWIDFSPSCFLPVLLFNDFKSAFAADLSFSALGERQRLCLYESMLVILFDVCRGLTERFRDDCILGVRTHERSWFCNLYSTLFRYRAGTGYPACVKWLVEHGFLCHTSSYRKSTTKCKGVSKAYWLGEPYAEYFLRYLWTGWKAKCGNGSHPIGATRSYTFESIFTKRRLYLDAVRRKEFLLKQSDISEMYDDLAHFKVDAEKARETMETLAAENKVPVERIKTEMDKVDRFGRMGDDPIAAYVVKDRYGRVHTNVTSMKKEIRENCMTCDGKPVGSVDIRSSQAAFLCSVFGMWQKLATDPLFGCEPRFVKLIPFWTPEEAPKVGAAITAELEQFKGLLHKGRIYEFFANAIGIADRKAVKKEWLAFLYAPIIFDRERHFTRYKIRCIWRKHFPTLLRCIDAMKRENYAALAHEMQSTESDFVFNGVIPLVRLFIGCPVCTVHDSLIVPREYVDAVKEIMDTELDRTGIPTMTVVEMDILNPSSTLRLDADKIRSAIEDHYRMLDRRRTARTVDPRKHSFDTEETEIEPCFEESLC